MSFEAVKQHLIAVNKCKKEWKNSFSVYLKRILSSML